MALEVTLDRFFFYSLFLFVPNHTYTFIFLYAGSLATLILPAAIYLKVMPEDSDMMLHAKVLLALGIAVMIAVVVVTIISMF